MDFYMYPFAHRRYTEMCKRVVLFVIMCFLLVLPLICLLTGLGNAEGTAIFVLGLTLPFVLIYVILWHRGRTFATAVCFEKDRVRVVTKGGKCKREIMYASVTDLGVQELECDFSTRYYRATTHIKHICFFLNGSTRIPKEGYYELFWHKDFFVMKYTVEAWEWVCRFTKQDTVE